MANIVEVCNAALMYLGDNTITSIDDEATRAKLCKTFLPIVMDAVLREHPWKCAMARAELARLEEAPAFGFSYQFQLPSDCLRVLGTSIDNYQSYDDPAPWQVEGNHLLCNETSISILYIQKLNSPGQMDALLVMYLAMQLAMTLAPAITDKANMVEGLSQLSNIFLQKARSVNSFEASQQRFESNVLVDVRT